MPQAQGHGENSGLPLISHPTLLLALGANLTSTAGGPATTLGTALDLIKGKGAVIRAVSPFYRTPAYPAGNGPDYVNAAAVLTADWTPDQALEILHGIEAALGRERQARWGQRTLDLDLIAVDDQVLPDAETQAKWRNLPADDQIRLVPDRLILPHPRLQDRSFVLVPLADVAPGWVHPILGLSVLQMRDALDPADLATVRRLPVP